MKAKASNRNYTGKIIHLTKVKPYLNILSHGSKSHRFFGLEAEADGRNCLRKSLFMDAINFLVGTL
jgi:hypothetical protein